jgi:isochorismate synthase
VDQSRNPRRRRLFLGRDAWTVAGSGSVLRLEANGAERFDRLRDEAAKSFSRVVEWAEPNVVAPRLRFFGGASFHVGVRDPSWTRFGDASFTLPRWLYGVHDGEAFLRFAFRRDELAHPETLLAEIERAESDADPNTENAASRSSAPPGNDLDASWRPLVEDALDAIRGGAFHKLVVARRSPASRSIPLSASIARLRKQNAESTTFAVVRGPSAFFGASPERLIFLDGNRFVTEALAGTIARGEDDEAAKRALFSSDKDRREHQVVVDGIAAALAPFSSGIDIPSEPGVRTLGRVHHLATPIVGRVDRDTHVLSLVSALHPTPAVSGLPQRAASEWIRDHESFERGWYAAPVGWFDDRGDGTFAVAIRSALVEENRAWVFAGAGIVDGSEPDAEFRETQLKQKTILAALGSTSGISP